MAKAKGSAVRKPRVTVNLKGLTGADRKAAMAANFSYIATRRLVACLHRIRQLGAAGNRSSYSYTSAQVDQIREALQQAVDRCLAKFEDKAQAIETGIKL